MQRLIVTVFLAFLLFTGSYAQESDKDKEKSKQMTRQEPSKVYWGGQLGLSFGSYFRISIIPMVAYKVTPKFHIGGKIGYAYTEDKRYENATITSHNYGGSVFSRYLIVKGLYAHGEYVYWSYRHQTDKLEGERTWVPFVLVGGGYVQPVSPNAAVFIEVLWDVLKHEDSPFNASDPWISIGVGVGF
jgi:hypothetical protein